MAKNKSWPELVKEISETFRKWHVEEWSVSPSKAPSARNRFHSPEQRLVRVAWQLSNGRRIALSVSSEAIAHDNLHLLALTVETLRMNDARKITRLVAGAYALMQPAPPPVTPPTPEPRAALNDPYVVLGVAPNYPLAVIETIWKARLRVEHPDAGGTTAQATALNAAMDEIRRRRV